MASVAARRGSRAASASARLSTMVVVPRHAGPPSLGSSRRHPGRRSQGARAARGRRPPPGRPGAARVAALDDGLVERYLRLGLRLGRHEEGVVDAYFGPPELAAAVAAEAPAEPVVLVADADALLDELEDGWLRDQV